MNGINDYSNIKKSTSLEELFISEATKQKPEDVVEALECKSLKKAAGFFGTSKKNEAFKKMVIEKGLDCDIELSDFAFI